LEVEQKLATKVAGIRIQEPENGLPISDEAKNGEVMVCLCERVKKSEVTRLVRLGFRDMNAIKAATRCGMGACNGKTCESLIRQVLVEEGVPPNSVVGYVKRPFIMELPVSALLKEVKE